MSVKPTAAFHEEEVQVIKPARVVIELSVDDASMLKAVIGRTTGNELYGLYSALTMVPGLKTAAVTINDSKNIDVKLAQ